MSEQNEGGSLSGFLLGGLLGVAAGLLLAPRAGKETRKRLQKWIDELEDKSQDLIEEGRELIDEGKDIIHQKAGRIKRVIDPGKKTGGNGHEDD